MKLNMNGSWIIDRKQTSQDVIPLEWCVVHNKSNKDKKGNFLWYMQNLQILLKIILEEYKNGKRFYAKCKQGFFGW